MSTSKTCGKELKNEWWFKSSERKKIELAIIINKNPEIVDQQNHSRNIFSSIMQNNLYYTNNVIWNIYI